MTEELATSPNTTPAQTTETQEVNTTETPVIKETVFGDDWREKLSAKDDGSVDDDLIKKLSRYNTPKDAAKALAEAQKKISEGIKKPLAKDATAEQVTAWRKENGIPEEYTGYDLNIEGVAIGEQDKPLIDTFLSRMHSKNATPELVKEAVAAYYEVQQQILDDTAVKDDTAQKQSEDVLRQEWGVEYRPNLHLASNLLAGAPEGLSGNLMTARMPDGSIVGNNPDVLRWLSSLARAINPIATITPTGNATVGDLNKEKSEIEGRMGTPAYTDADRMRWAELDSIENKISSRG